MLWKVNFFCQTIWNQTIKFRKGACLKLMALSKPLSVNKQLPKQVGHRLPGYGQRAWCPSGDHGYLVSAVTFY